MSDALHTVTDRLLIPDAPLPKRNVHAETLSYDIFQHIELNLSHWLDIDTTRFLIPHDMQFRIFFLQLPKLFQRGDRIGAVRK